MTDEERLATIRVVCAAADGLGHDSSQQFLLRLLDAEKAKVAELEAARCGDCGGPRGEDRYKGTGAPT